MRRYFSQDRPFYAYALGDLTERMWHISTFLGAYHHSALKGVALIWKGVEPGVFLMFGSPEAAEALLASAPDRNFYMLPADLLPVFQKRFKTLENTNLWRMAVSSSQFVPHHSSMPGLRRLTGADLPKLQRLYADDGPRAEVIEAISTEQIDTGVFFGVENNGTLHGVAGSHVCAQEEGVGAVGYVYTAHQQRGKGYATATTSAVTATFFKLGIETVILNVAQDNTPAIRTYHKLGYVIHTPFVEGPATPYL